MTAVSTGIWFLLAVGCAAEAPELPESTSQGDDTVAPTTEDAGDTQALATSAAATSTGAPGTDDGMACVPGMQIACVCPDGDGGSQACNEDGTAYLPCDCGDPSTTTATDTGISDCASDPDCLTCQRCASANDCLAETEACVMQPGCPEYSACQARCDPDDANCFLACQRMVSRQAVAVYSQYALCIVDACPACGMGADATAPTLHD